MHEPARGNVSVATRPGLALALGRFSAFLRKELGNPAGFRRRYRAAFDLSRTLIRARSEAGDDYEPITSHTKKPRGPGGFDRIQIAAHRLSRLPAGRALRRRVCRTVRAHDPPAGRVPGHGSVGGLRARRACAGFPLLVRDDGADGLRRAALGTGHETLRPGRESDSLIGYEDHSDRLPAQLPEGARGCRPWRHRDRDE